MMYFIDYDWRLIFNEGDCYTVVVYPDKGLEYTDIDKINNM